MRTTITPGFAALFFSAAFAASPEPELKPNDGPAVVLRLRSGFGYSQLSPEPCFSECFLAILFPCL
jgi:hypothetical protein